MDVHSEPAKRYIMYAEFAERARLASDWRMYELCIDHAAFWFCVACFGREKK
jgi:hypothetical protein